MGKVSYGDLVLLLNTREEGSLVGDLECKDAVLVRRGESGAEDRAVGGRGGRRQRNAVERREHGEFQLESVVGRNRERHVMRLVVLANFDRVFLKAC